MKRSASMRPWPGPVYPRVVLDPGRPLVFPVDMERAKAIVARRGPVSLVIGQHSATPGYQKISGLLIAQLASIGVKATSYALPPEPRST